MTLPTRSEPPALSTRGLVARIRQGLFNAPAVLAFPGTARRVTVRLQARLAELLLINRLRARSQPALSADVLERGAHVVRVTCESWFAVTISARAASRAYDTRI